MKIRPRSLADSFEHSALRFTACEPSRAIGDRAEQKIGELQQRDLVRTNVLDELNGRAIEVPDMVVENLT